MPDRNYYKQLIQDLKVCVIVPTYNNSTTISGIITQILEWTNNIIIVNDGSTDNTTSIISSFKEINLVDYPENKGKGNALKQGFKKALELGFKYAVTIDSDGQHLVEDLAVFLDKIIEEPNAIIVGARNMDQEGIPRKSSFGHKFSNFWFKFETGINLPDTQSGYRLYPLERIRGINLFTNKYELEIEVLVRAAWKGINVISVPVHVIYQPKETRISHFRPITDFSRVSVLNTVLVILAVFIYKPIRFAKKLNKQDIKAFIIDNVINSKESNSKIAVSVAFGILWGILPVWGWQLAFAIALAYLFKLNKIIVITTANISIPPMIPLVLYLSYKTGGLVLGLSTSDLQYSSKISFEYIRTNIYMYALGSIVFAFAASISLGIISFILLSIFRKRRISS